VRSANAIRQFEPAETAAAYSAAREAAICHGDDKAWQTVGRALVDWDRPQQALSAGVGAGNAGTEDLVSRGRALLMRGRPAEAAELFRRAVAESGVTAASATGFGDAERDLGLVAIKSNDLAGAGKHFETAGRHYLAAIEHTQKESERGVILVNLGDLALLRIRLDPDAAEARMDEAKSYYERARRHGDPPHARLGLARISLLRAQLIPQQEVDAAEGGFGEVLAANIILAMLANDQRKPHWQDARRQLAALTAEVPGFAPAEELLGEVLYESGKADDSGKKFQRAIAADPGNTSAYLAYSKTLKGDKKRMYGNAYKLVEVPAVRELASTRREILIPRTQPVKVPPAPLTANVTKLSFSQEIRQQTVTMTNRSNAPATVSAANITGSHLAAFEVVSNGCLSGPIAAGADCRIAIAFVAKTSGTYRATLELTFVGAMLRREVKLNGSVSAPAPEGDEEGEPVIE
jgi:tetratricopeptide (TPR) repeat protein